MSKNEMDKAIEEMGAEQRLQTEPAAERPADGTVKAKPASPKAVKMVKCVINSSEGTEGANDVFVSLNGVAYQIRRDVEVALPEPVLQVLKEAVIHGYVTDQNGAPVKNKLIPRYAITITG